MLALRYDSNAYTRQDFLDENDTKRAKDAIGEFLFPTLGDICFSLTAPRTGVDLRCTVRAILE